MAQRKRQRRRPAPSGEARVAAPAAEAAPASRSSGALPWARAYLAAFAVVEVALLSVFLLGGGESRAQEAMLARADAAREAGRPAKALAILDEFGERWPGARETAPYNVGLGEAAREAGDNRRAAEAFLTAYRLNPQEPGAAARAGEALWLIDAREDAAELFRRELSDGDASDPRARALLGLVAFDQGAPRDALSHFAAGRPPEEPWASDVQEVRQQVRAELPSEPQPAS